MFYLFWILKENYMKDIVPILQIRKLKLDIGRLSAQSNVATKWLNTGYSFNWSDSKIFVSFSHYIYCIASQESFDYLLHTLAILYRNRNCLYCVSDATSFLDHIKFRDDTWPISLTVKHPFLLETVPSCISQSPQSPDFLLVSLGYCLSPLLFSLSPQILTFDCSRAQISFLLHSFSWWSHLGLWLQILICLPLSNIQSRPLYWSS